MASSVFTRKAPKPESERPLRRVSEELESKKNGTVASSSEGDQSKDSHKQFRPPRYQENTVRRVALDKSEGGVKDKLLPSVKHRFCCQGNKLGTDGTFPNSLVPKTGDSPVCPQFCPYFVVGLSP